MRKVECQETNTHTSQVIECNAFSMKVGKTRPPEIHRMKKDEILLLKWAQILKRHSASVVTKFRAIIISVQKNIC